MASVRGRLLGSSLDPARTALPLIRTGTQHTLGPVRISCLWPRMERKMPIYYERKKEIATPKNTSKPKKRGPDCFCFCFCFCFCSTPFFFNGQRHQTKRKIKDKEKTGVRIWPSLAGYGLGTRIRATLARILNPGPDSDPHLLIRVRVLALKHGLFGLFMDFLRTFPDSICT